MKWYLLLLAIVFFVLIYGLSGNKSNSTNYQEEYYDLLYEYEELENENEELIDCLQDVDSRLSDISDMGHYYYEANYARMSEALYDIGVYADDSRPVDCLYRL